MILEPMRRREQAATPDHRHRVEHMGNWMMTPERVMRAKQLGILPLPTRRFSSSWDPMVEMLQASRYRTGFPSVHVDAGSLELRSDSPGYYPVDPLRDSYSSGASDLSGQKITAGEALTMPEAARQTSTPRIRASRKAPREHRGGKLADIVVLVMTLTFAPARFQELPVDVTIAGGKVVHTGAVRLQAGAPATGWSPRAVAPIGEYWRLSASRQIAICAKGDTCMKPNPLHERVVQPRFPEPSP